MRIAFLTPYLPYPPNTGGKNRTYNLLKRLGQSHQVDLYVPSYQPVPKADGGLGSFCSNIWIYVHRVRWTRRQLIRDKLTLTPATVLNFSRPGTVTEMRSALAKRDYDLVFVDEIVMAPYAWELNAIPKVLARQKADFLHYRDLFLRGPWSMRRMWWLVEWLRVRAYEAKVWSVYHSGIVVSDEERDIFLSIRSDLDLCVVPNGVDLQFFDFRAVRDSEEIVILYHGVMSYPPNVDAMVFFFDQIYPFLRAKLANIRVMIVGRDPATEVRALERYDNVEVVGAVPDMRPYLERSSVVIVPLRLGRGTRIKILETMAAGRPIVSTSVGCEGLAVRDGEHLLIANRPRDFAEAVVRLLGDFSFRRRLAENGRKLVEEAYSWDRIGAKLNQFCCEVAKGQGSAPPSALLRLGTSNGTRVQGPQL